MRSLESVSKWGEEGQLNAMFDIDETALGIGVNAYLTLATDFLSDPGAYTG